MSDDTDIQHPALKDFKPGKEKVKFVFKNAIKKAAKYALIGGAILGGLMALPALGVGITGGLISTLTFGLVGSGSGAVSMGMLGAAALKGLIIGGVAGAAAGALGGVVNSDEAVSEAEERKIMNYDRLVQRQRSEQMYAMQQQRMAASGMQPVSPGGALPNMNKSVDGPGMGFS